MPKKIFFCALVFSLAGQIFAAADTGDLIFPAPAPNPESQAEKRKSALPSAAEILAQARANFPRAAFLIKGQILSGGRLGKLERVCYLDMFLELGDDPAVACYRLSDVFGTPFEQMTVSLAEDRASEFEYEAGHPLRPAAAPSALTPIRGTDLTWSDLSLLFLGRADGRTARVENLRGRECYVLEFPSNGRSATRLWIDTQLMVLLQMEESGPDGKLQRRLTVKNIKKISEQWMIKNMEIRSYPALHHTLIRIDEVIMPPGPDTPP